MESTLSLKSPLILRRHLPCSGAGNRTPKAVLKSCRMQSVSASRKDSSPSSQGAVMMAVKEDTGDGSKDYVAPQEVVGYIFTDENG